MTVCDVIVIGAGPAGIAAGGYSERKGLKTLLLYQVFGGQINYTDELFSIPSNPAVSSAMLLKSYEKNVQNVEQARTRVLSIAKESDIFQIVTEQGAYQSKSVIACTGAVPHIPPVLRESGEKIFTYNDYPYTEFSASDEVLIVGGGYCGLDISARMADLVRNINIVEKSSHLGGNAYRIKETANKANIAIHYNSEVVAIDGDQCLIKGQGGSFKQSFTKIVCSVGDIPHSVLFEDKLVNPSNLGVVINRNHDRWQENMTAVNGLFAAGDVVDIPIKGFVSVAEGMGIQSAMAAYCFLTR